MPIITRLFYLFPSLILGSVVLLCSGCNHAATQNQPSPSIAWGNCTTTNDPEFQCGELAVPLNYQNSYEGTTTLYIMKYIKAGTKPNQILFFNDGGPWGGQTHDLPLYIPFLDPRITNQYEIVTFDPRGVGGSQNLTCSTPLNQSIFLANPMTDQGLSNLISLYQQKWQTCAGQYQGFQNYVGTLNTAQDLDQVRRVLNVNQITYLGYSYGTQLGPIYLMLYPHHVAKMVLDSVMTPNRDFIQLSLDQGAAFEDTLNNFFTQCDANSSCPLYPNAQQAYEQAMNKVLNQTIPTQGQSYNIPLNSVAFFTAVEVALPWTDSSSESVNPVLFAPNLWADYLAQGIADINHSDDGTILQSLALINGEYNPSLSQYTVDNSIYNSVLCTDFVNHPSNAAILAAAAYARGQYPLIGGFVASQDLPMCSGWSSIGQALPKLTDVANVPKILLTCNDHDPETPYSWCQHLASMIPNATVVHFTGAGHGIYLSNEPPGTCVENYVNAYLLNGTLPASGTICDDTHNPTTPSNGLMRPSIKKNRVLSF